MGRTNATYRNHLDNFIERFKPFRQGLRSGNQMYLDGLWEKAHKHAQAGDRQNSPNPGISIIISILVGLQRDAMKNNEDIENLRKRVEELEE